MNGTRNSKKEMHSAYMVVQNKRTGRKMLVDRASMKKVIAKGDHKLIGGEEAIREMKREKRQHIHDTVIKGEMDRIKLNEEIAREEERASKISTY